MSVPPRWFAALGLPFDSADLGAAEALCGLLPTFTTTIVAEPVSAMQAERIVASIDEEGAWWELQETEREALWLAAVERHGEDVLVGRLAIVGSAAAAAVPLPPPSAGLSGNAQRAAREAALLAVHHAALAELAGAGGHWFVHKERLFALGRWVLGLRHGRLVVY